MNEVEAVKSKNYLITIHTLLKRLWSQDFADIWRLGVNVALRISDLLSIRTENIDLVRQELEVVEGKTKKRRLIRLNDTAVKIIQRRQEVNYAHKYLFQSIGHRGRSLDKPMHRSTVARKFKEIGLIVGVKLGTHSMRKIRGYMLHKAVVSIEQIARVLNHSSPSVTMAYIGLTREATMQTYDDFDL